MTFKTRVLVKDKQGNVRFARTTAFTGIEDAIGLQDAFRALDITFHHKFREIVISPFTEPKGMEYVWKS